MKDKNAQASQSAPNHSSGARPLADFAVSHHTTISLFHPLSRRATDWLAAHCPQDGEHQYFGNSLVIEHRFVESILRHATNDGLVQSVTNRQEGN